MSLGEKNPKTRLNTCLFDKYMHNTKLNLNYQDKHKRRNARHTKFETFHLI